MEGEILRRLDSKLETCVTLLTSASPVKMNLS